MKSPYEILQKPIVTEKSLDVKERHRTLCFRVRPDAPGSKASVDVL